MRTTFDRAFYRPAGIAAAIIDEALGIEVYYESDRIAIAFAGKRAKPDFYTRFATQARRDEYVAQWIDGIKAAAARKIERRREAAEWQHGCQVGDIFRASWGYDQTNIDYWEIVAVKGKAVEVLKISQQSEDTGWLQGDCVPAPGRYLEEPDYTSAESIAHHERTGRYLTQVPKPRRMVPQRGYNGEPVLSVYSFAHARLHKPQEVAPGVKVFAPDHWTAYA